MLRRAVWAFWGGAAVLLGSTAAHAQCTKDTDCKGDRVCEAGKCTSPLPPAPAAPPGEPPQPETITLEEDPAAAGQANPGQAPASDAAPAGAPAQKLDAGPDPGSREGPTAAVTSLGTDEPEVRRRNRGMMVGGIVMVSVGPLALLGALSASNSQENCDQALAERYPDHVVPSSDAGSIDRCDSYTVPIYVLGIGGAVLVAAGLPMIIYGAKTLPAEPKSRAQLIPWATPGAGGLRLRLDL